MPQVTTLGLRVIPLVGVQRGVGTEGSRVEGLSLVSRPRNGLSEGAYRTSGRGLVEGNLIRSGPLETYT